jgi:hypothetical protein
MYYTIKWRGSATEQSERTVDVSGLSEAVTVFDADIRKRGGASLWHDGHEVMHGHMVGNRVVINWRD